MDSFISHLNGHGARISVRINDHRFHTQTPTGFYHPDGDLAAIGNQDFLEHLQAPRVCVSVPMPDLNRAQGIVEVAAWSAVCA